MHLYQFKELNKAKGFHWFDKDTMRFFGTRISNWDVITGYFITSEQPPHGPRTYTLRKADFDTGNVSTIGEFGQYKTMAQARGALKRALNGTARNENADI